MDRDQRLEDNPALIEAQALAIAENQPLHVVCVLTPGMMSPRQYVFMVQGLIQLEPLFGKKNISFSVLSGEPETVLATYIKKNKIGVVVTDFSPLRKQRSSREALASSVDIEVREVDAHNIVPCWVASEKKEYGAQHLRLKLQKLLPLYLLDFPAIKDQPVGAKTATDNDWDSLAKSVVVKLSDKPLMPSGVGVAQMVLDAFVDDLLADYPANQNIATRQGQSGLSPYLHFGQISAQRVALAVTESDVDPYAKEVFLDQLIVRRELSDNFCFYDNRYDSLAAFPSWARQAFNDHVLDPRPHLNTPEEFETAKTHDALWNACQTDLIRRGRMPGYLRMYWAKKILEWTDSPTEALQTAIRLNDMYALDGNDPNGYTGIAWSIGGVHDKPWTDRAIFGQVRYMNLVGCRKKFNVEAYIHKANKPEPKG
jgi:deoxyribodipyrimidine photo-lyase